MSGVTEAQAYLTLLGLFEGGSERWSALYAKYGAVELVARIRSGEYIQESKSGALLQQKAIDFDSEAKLLELEKSGAFLITRADIDWPTALNDLVAPPFALIGRGDRTTLTELSRSLAIVGTRNPTHYGVRVAGDFAAGAVDRDWLVVSGGALGIDSAAHRGALLAEGRTIAILGCGVATNFPSSSARLFDEIRESGLLLSEVLPYVHAIPTRFLIRNRLIAAIARATLVVEAAFRSGSLRTARDASEIFRPVFAVPGPITSPTSDGCHRLIAERRAELVCSIGDLMELLTPLA